MSYTPLVFRSSDTGALLVGGTAGELITNVLTPCLTIFKQYNADTDTNSNYTDNTAEAQSNITGQTPYNLFNTAPSGTTNFNQDAAYFGMTARFDRLFVNLAVVGVANTAITLAWEYWNGSAWTALSSVADGTTGLTASGVVTWTNPAALWTTVSRNGVTCFWVRVRYTAGSWTTRPTCNYTVVTGWVKPFADSSSSAAYQMLGGTGMFLSVNDNAPGNARNARPLGYETMSAIRTGTGSWPTAEAATMTWRKSTAIDTATRSWLLWADDRTIYGFILSGDAASRYDTFAFGDFYSFIPNDSFRSLIGGDDAETAGTLSTTNAKWGTFSTTSAITAHYVDRAYTGVGGSTAFGKNTLMSFVNYTTFACTTAPTIQFPNGSDGGIYLSPIVIVELAAGTLRGLVRGLYACIQAGATNFTDGDTFSGSGAYAGKTFLCIKGDVQSATAGYFLETSNTLPTN